MNQMLMLIRREIWENRSLWIAPLVIAGVLLITAAFGGIHVGDNGRTWFGAGAGDSDLSQLEGHFDKQQLVYGLTISVFTSVQLFTLGIVVFFYLLDALLAERKDRSILFWKSMPISDTQVVGSKVLTALVVAPVFVLLVSALTQVLFAFVWSMRFGGTPLAVVLMPWDGEVWMQVQAGFWMLAPTTIVWYLPLAGYLLLVSVWARKNAFLWAVLPPAAILMVEGLITRSHHFADFLGRRFIGVFEIMDLEPGGGASADSLGELARHVGFVYADLETWAGVAVAIAFFVVIVRFRRFRDEG